MRYLLKRFGSPELILEICNEYDLKYERYIDSGGYCVSVHPSNTDKEEGFGFRAVSWKDFEEADDMMAEMLDENILSTEHLLRSGARILINRKNSQQKRLNY